MYSNIDDVQLVCMDLVTWRNNPIRASYLYSYIHCSYMHAETHKITYKAISSLN